MTTRTNTPSSSVAVDPLPPAWLSQRPVWTMQDRLQRIQALGEQISKYIKFMCEVEKLAGTSTEAKERSVAAFYERMVTLEQQLGRIQEDLPARLRMNCRILLSAYGKARSCNHVVPRQRTN